MEDQVRPTSATMTPPDKQRPWLESPAFDLCFLANLWWPAVVILGWLASGTDTWFGFWQIYFLTTPHRWLTLVLVVADPDRRAGRTSWLIGIAILATAAVSCIWLFTGQLHCLVLADYLWNAWHFGSQHGGIARMYARRGGAAASRSQTWALRLLVVYTAVRVAGWSTGWLEAWSRGAAVLMAIDVIVIVVATIGAQRALRGRERRAYRGWRIYIASVVVLYASLLLAINARLSTLTAALVAAGAAVHAIEYLAIVSYYARRREHRGTRGLFSSMARQWTWLLLVYVVLLGSLAYFSDRHWQETWLAINVIAAFVHYAYDGMIWRLRELRTSAALDVSLSDPGAAS